MRVPDKSEHPRAHIRGVTAWYDSQELAAAGGVPLGAQVMGSTPELLALAAQYLVEVGG